MKEDKKQQIIKILEFKEKLLREEKNKIVSRHHLNLGIFYGLFFGVIGNLFIMLVYELLIKEWSDTIKGIICILIIFIIMIVCILVLRDNNHFKQTDKEIDEEIANTVAEIDRVEDGAVI